MSVTLHASYYFIYLFIFWDQVRKSERARQGVRVYESEDKSPLFFFLRRNEKTTKKRKKQKKYRSRFTHSLTPLGPSIHPPVPVPVDVHIYIYIYNIVYLAVGVCSFCIVLVDSTLSDKGLLRTCTYNLHIHLALATCNLGKDKTRQDKKTK